MFWNLSLKSLATNRSPSWKKGLKKAETNSPFDDKKEEVIPHVIDVAWAMNLALPYFFMTCPFDQSCYQVPSDNHRYSSIGNTLPPP